MESAAWGIEQWKGILEIGSPVVALVFAGLALVIDARVRRAQTIIEITKQHRELWTYFHDVTGHFKTSHSGSIQNPPL